MFLLLVTQVLHTSSISLKAGHNRRANDHLSCGSFVVLVRLQAITGLQYTGGNQACSPRCSPMPDVGVLPRHLGQCYGGMGLAPVPML